jgi:AcrR family transcriptional regulator
MGAFNRAIDEDGNGETMKGDEFAGTDVAAARKAHGDVRRQELVQAAYRLIAEHGFEGLRTRDVAAQSGVNIATLHYYFPSKEDLIRGVVDYIHAQFNEQTETIAARGLSARERLHAELWQALELKRDHPELQIVLHEFFLRSLRDQAVQKIFLGMDATWHAAITDILSAGVYEGSFRADLDVDAAASAIIAFIKGASIQLAREPDRFDYARIVAEFERWLARDTG